MESTDTGIAGSWLLSPVRYADDRGWFQEWFRRSTVAEVCGYDFAPVQANISHSRRGTIRGIHYSIAPEGQAKLVTVLAGEIDDYVVDVRPQSSTFGQWIRRRLSAENGAAMLISAHLGHAFHALVDGTVVAYLVTAEYNPTAEHAVTPFCPHVEIDWPDTGSHVVTDKDKNAPDLHAQLAAGRLPRD